MKESVNPTPIPIPGGSADTKESQFPNLGIGSRPTQKPGSVDSCTGCAMYCRLNSQKCIARGSGAQLLEGSAQGVLVLEGVSTKPLHKDRPGTEAQQLVVTATSGVASAVLFLSLLMMMLTA